MKIQGLYNISNTDANCFYKDLTNAIIELQQNQQNVEIQYQVNSFNDGQLVYSALIIGREKDCNNIKTNAL